MNRKYVEYIEQHQFISKELRMHQDGEIDIEELLSVADDAGLNTIEEFRKNGDRISITKMVSSLLDMGVNIGSI